MANYPAAAATFPARIDSQSIFAAHLNALQDEVAALEAALIGGTRPTPQRITGPIPTLTLADATGRGGRALLGATTHMDFANNVGEDGTGWVLDQPSVQGALLGAGSGGFNFWGFLPGTNPRPATLLWTVNSNGITERSRGLGLGVWGGVVYNAGNFTAQVGSWTVPAGNVQFYYALVGKTCHIYLIVGSTTTSATPTALFVGLPFASVNQLQGVYMAYPVAGVWTTALYGVGAGSPTLVLYPTAAATGTWVASPNIAIRLYLTYQIP